jgi:hypothetical protein
MAKKKSKEPMKFSKKIIILMFATMILFTLTMIITFWKHESVPDALIEPFFAFFGVEGGALGVIRVSENIAEKFEIKRGKKK